MAGEVFTVILLYAGQLFGASDGNTGDPLTGSSPYPRAVCRGERSLLENGFHREMRTHLVITAKEEVAASTQCETLMIENLSSSFYIDPYQIETAREFGGPKVFSYDDIDLEKPAFLSPPLRLYVFHWLERRGDTFSSNVTMPLHVRYHKPLDGPSHVPVEVVLPVVYIACHSDSDWLKSLDRTTAPCSKNTSTNCTWTRIFCTFPEESLSFSVPVGNLQHFTAVVVLTVLIISISTLAIVGKMVLSTTPSCTAEVKKDS